MQIFLFIIISLIILSSIAIFLLKLNGVTKLKLFIYLICSLIIISPVLVFLIIEYPYCSKHNWSGMCGVLTGLISLPGAYLYYLLFGGGSEIQQNTMSHFLLALKGSCFYALIIIFIYSYFTKNIFYQNIFSKIKVFFKISFLSLFAVSFFELLIVNLLNNYESNYFDLLFFLQIFRTNLKFIFFLTIIANFLFKKLSKQKVLFLILMSILALVVRVGYIVLLRGSSSSEILLNFLPSYYFLIWVFNGFIIASLNLYFSKTKDLNNNLA